jgi:hypothetical protein
VSAHLYRITGVAAIVLAGFGCDLFEELDSVERTDGDPCQTAADCSSGVCTTSGLCSHSSCQCPRDACGSEGTEVAVCRDGWVCVDYDSIFDPVVEFFGGMPAEDRGYCQPRCDADCPEHYACDAQGVFCKPDTLWAHPRPAIRWSGPVYGDLEGSGQSTTVTVAGGTVLVLEGSATSPTGAEITTLQWTTVSQAGDYATWYDERIEITVPEGPGSYRRAELTAVDDQLRSGVTTVIFEACIATGGVCGFEGSGCCSGCDSTTNLCG